MLGDPEERTRFFQPRLIRFVQPDNPGLDRGNSAENITQRHRCDIQSIRVIAANDRRPRQDRDDLGTPGRYSQCRHCATNSLQQFALADRVIQSLCPRFPILTCLAKIALQQRRKR